MDEYKLRQQSEAAARLMDELKGADAADDPDFVLDAVEGETDLLESIESGIAEIDNLEILTVGLTEKIRDFQHRKSVFQNRADRIRALIEQAMAICEQTKITLDTATLSLRQNKPNVVIHDEAIIPATYFMQPPPPPPKVDKAALKAALEAGKTINGAELDNGSVSLAIRRK